MSSSPLVSIVVPIHNAEQYIGSTIESVLGQTYTNWELILIDDCSSDRSVEIIKSYLGDERIKFFQNETNLKAAATRNEGIAKSKGELLCFLDADDIWLKDKLQKQVEFVKKMDCAFSYTAYEFGDEQAVGTGRIVKVLPRLDYKHALSRTIIFTSTVMFNLNKLNREDIMMPEVPSEDTATWWSILRRGYIAYGLDEVLTIYRRPSISLSSNKLVAVKRIWFLYRRVERLNVFRSTVCFLGWAYRATMRRI